MKQEYCMMMVLGFVLVLTLCFKTPNEYYQDSKTQYSQMQQSKQFILSSGPSSPLSFAPSAFNLSITPSSSPNSISYDPTNIDTQYHTDDAFKNDTYEPTQIQGKSTFYDAGTFPYGPSSFVPTYEDSVYLSRSSGIHQNYPVYNTVSNGGGFCHTDKHSPDVLESRCNHLDTNVCASTGCCVLLGGSKCVSGNERGITMKSNYNDPQLLNKDYYYYQGKCYGNCFGVN
jgi:hypothetical protein